MDEPQVVDFIDQFCEALRQQLLEDAERHGSTWLELNRKDQVFRIRDRLDQYFHEWVVGGGVNGPDYPWLKGAGNMMIGWIRDNFPGLSACWSDEDVS